MNPNIQYVHSGEVIPDLWCSACHKQTEHVFDPHCKTPLTCLRCFPDKDPRKEVQT